MKKYGNDFILQPERQQTFVLAMMDPHQIFIYTSEGTLVLPLIRHK